MCRGGELTCYERRVASQNGEDGVIAELLRRCGVGDRFFLEIGVGTGKEANCVALADQEGWAGVFVEANASFYEELARKYADSRRVRTVHAAASPANVNGLLADAPDDCEVLSIDIDGADYWVWEALETRPRIVVIEYNSHLPFERRLVQPLAEAEKGWDATDYYGASLGALRTLATKKGYVFAHTERTGCNAFFVREDLAQAVPRRPPIHPPNFFLKGIRHRPDPYRRPYVDLDATRADEIQPGMASVSLKPGPPDAGA